MFIYGGRLTSVIKDIIRNISSLTGLNTTRPLLYILLSCVLTLYQMNQKFKFVITSGKSQRLRRAVREYD